MIDRLNKPRLFLSHAKADIDFIKRICDDLRKCQIEPWLDSEEIRHGKPWLDAIFEEGIPTCDSVLVYFTVNSLKSSMVKKEIDSSLLSQLKENSIAFLPYVNNAEIRQELRVDIQALQVPVWNDDNYSALLPQVVAEIWRGYLERQVSYAIKTERLRRLEAELELEKTKRSVSGNVFNDSENRDFKCIWQKIDRFETVSFEKKKQNEKREWEIISTHMFSVHIGSLLPFISDSKESDYHRYLISNLLQNILKPFIKENDSKDISLELKPYPDIGNELLMYGFVDRVYAPPPQNEVGKLRFLGGNSFKFVYSQKIERFKYWLAFNGLLPQEIIWKALE